MRKGISLGSIKPSAKFGNYLVTAATIDAIEIFDDDDLAATKYFEQQVLEECYRIMMTAAVCGSPRILRRVLHNLYPAGWQDLPVESFMLLQNHLFEESAVASSPACCGIFSTCTVPPMDAHLAE